MAFAGENASLAELKRLFSTLSAPSPEQRQGFFRAQFVGPAWLRHSARPSLELSGLPGWQGKKFLDCDSATNVLKKGGVLTDALRMQVVPGLSRVDGKTGVALHYLPGDGRPAPLPWRWIQDEMRVLDENTLLCMTVIDLPLLRHLAFPFLLIRER